MKENILGLLNQIFKTSLMVVIFATLLLFWNLTTEFYDTPKFLILIIFIGIGLIVTTLRFALSEKVFFIQTPLDLPLILLLLAGIVSTIFSSAPFGSLLGHASRIHTSLAAIISYVLFYFLLTQNLKNLKDVKILINFLLIGAVLASVVSLLSYTGLKLLPSPWVHGTNFTPTGSSFTTTAILAMLLPFPLIGLLTARQRQDLVLNFLAVTIFGVTIALTGTGATYLAAVLAVSLTSLILKPSLGSSRTFLQQPGPALLGASLVLVGLILTLSFVPPIGKAQNPLYNLAKSFPREPQLGLVGSWKIAISTFRDSPIWGSGPSTFMFDFNSYKPVRLNQTKFWDIRFDSAFNEYLQTLATLGGLGITALLLLTAFYMSTLYRTISVAINNHYRLGLAVSGLLFLIVIGLHAATLAVWVVGLTVLACFMILSLESKSKAVSAVFSKITGSLEMVKLDILPSSLFIVVSALVLAAFYSGGKLALADFHHRQALNADTQNKAIDAYNRLVIAEKLNPQSDLYRIGLAQTSFALASALIQAKGPTETSPAGSLTDQDKINIQQLLSQAVNEGKMAVSLSPKNPVNWEILANIYRQISGVAQNALAFSLDAYGKAILLDPLNPQLRLSAGGIYYAGKNYDMAVRLFTDAINLKPDFANGYYNLSVALRDKGDLKAAIGAAERALVLIDKNSQDFEVANSLLNDLRSQTQTATSSGQLGVPTAKEEGPLQQEKLPKVLDLPKPENIASPPAVKR
ncbi:O-antigen ligase family protein [Candidatus Microgenomates bacterium]|nr:O-antigen ligase family protein [Candidatus Microgenomates bacterium]